jgi:signal transduction histidine kinase
VIAEVAGETMFRSPRTGRGSSALLYRYGQRLAQAAEHHRADVATREAHRERALATISRIDLLKEQARDPGKTEFIAHSFVAHMSHELRTPLNAIIGFSDLLGLRLKEMSCDQKVLGYVADINNAGLHLLRVVNDILDLSKIEAGKLELHEDIVDFSELAESCARLIRGQLDAKPIKFTAIMAPDLPLLRVDELKLKQIVINLLSNAVKFTPAGTITLEAHQEPRHGFIISISDTGIGIAAEDIPNVFTPFTQLKADVSRPIAGTGLGLPLTKALVELHGGSLAIESTLGAGTTVTVTVPASRVVRPVPAPADADSDPA